MTARNLFPWLIFILGLLFLKFIYYLPLLNAVVSVAFAAGAADILVWVMAPDCHKFLHKFIQGTIIEYTNQAAVGGLIWFIVFASILITRYVL